MRRNYKGVSINTSKNTHEKVFSLIEHNTASTIVDIPCGAGAFVLRLKDNGFKNVVAVDIENILQIDHDRFSVGDMTNNIPMDDNSVDSLVCIDGIEHISKQTDFVKEVNRSLRVGGTFIVSTPNINSLRSRLRWFMTGHHYKCETPLDENNPNPLHHIGMISFPEIRYLLHSNGFHIVEVTTNRVKPISWLYAIFVPLCLLFTTLAYRNGKKNKTSVINHEMKKVMFSEALLFGETLIVKAEKITNCSPSRQ